jgi:TPR repeat protein
MTSAGSSLSLSAFATAESGSEYLATAEHYQHLAKGIVDALHRGSLVLVTGDPPADPPMLATALREASAPRPVIELPCGPDLDCVELLGGGSACPRAATPGAIGEDAGSSALSSPIYLFADADRLSDDQIEEFYEAGQAMLPGPYGFEAGVLLARSDFVTRAGSVESPLLEEGLAGHLRVQQLERDEVEAFIRRQLLPGEGANLFSAQRVALIALTSGGDPAVVNRLARRMLEIEPDVSNPPRAVPRRYAVSLKLPAGIIICLGAAWLVAGGAFERQGFGDFVGLVRDNMLPRNEQARAGPGVTAAPAPAIDPPSVNVAIAPPNAASADETIPEPAPRPGADGQRLSAAEIATLVARGDTFLAAGDIASARLFFERAADSGDGRAAMRMAVTYDAAFLDRAGLHGLGSDLERAAFWYLRARELGEGKAEAPPGALGTPGSAEPPLQSR